MNLPPRLSDEDLEYVVDHSLSEYGGVFVRPMFEIIRDNTSGSPHDCASWPEPTIYQNLDNMRRDTDALDT